MANEKKATRAAYGETLIELANAGVPVVAVEADLSEDPPPRRSSETPTPSVFSMSASPSRTWSASPLASL